MAKSAKDALDVALPAMTEFAKANKCDAYVVAVFDASSTLVDSRRVEGSPDIILKILRAKALEVKASGKKNAGATPMPVFMCCHLPCILCCGMPTTTMGAAHSNGSSPRARCPRGGEGAPISPTVSPRARRCSGSPNAT